jgi:hypothetical protein
MLGNIVEALHQVDPRCEQGSDVTLKASKIEAFDLMWSHLESNQAPTDYESVALTE